MISSKNAYHEYILKECGHNSFLKCYILSYVQFLPTNRFLLLLRTSEYYMNCKSGFFNKIIHFFIKYNKYRLGLRLGFTIPENVAQKGLQLPHYGTIVINAKAKIGKNCRIHVCTNIGAANKSSVAPVIGDNVYIGPGVKIYGKITIANNTRIAPNAAVSKSFLEEGLLIGGVPAKIIKTS